MQWVRADGVVAIHKRQVSEHGARGGFRDLGKLESSLEHPRQILTNEPDADVARLAAAYAFGIVKNHPFLDGNKRTGYVVMETFLIKNGMRLEATVVDKYLTFISLAEGSISEEELAEWLRDRVTGGE